MQVLALLCFVAALAAPAASTTADPAAEISRRGADFVELLAAGEFGRAVELYDATMRKALPEGELRGTWDELTAQVGSFREQTSLRTERAGGYDAVIVTCRFDAAWIDVRVVFDGEARVAGLFFRPTTAPPAAPPPGDTPGERFVEHELQIGSAEWPLPATLSVPRGEGPFPALVLVHGSGPHDRDETVGPNKPFRDLAFGLAARGVAVLRYEKRTLEHRDKLLAAPEITVQEEVVDDALAAVAAVRARTEIRSDAVFVAGHSLGGTLAPRIALEDPAIAGLVILAGATRPIEQLLLEQLDYIASLDGTISEAEERQIADVRRQVARLDAAANDDGASSAGESILGAPAAYWLDLRAYDPAATASQVRRPMWIAQGGRDYQVTLKDLRGWKRALAGRPDVTFKVYPKLNHLLIEGRGPSSPAEYQTPGRVSERLIVELARWIGQRLPSPSANE